MKSAEPARKPCASWLGIALACINSLGVRSQDLTPSSQLGAPHLGQLCVMRRRAPARQHQQARATNAATICLAAFSLVELLVVLFVIGVLAALLLPAVTRSKSNAKEAQCISNLKQIYLGFLMYPPDNGGRCPAGFLWQGKVWTSGDFIGGRDGRDTNAPPALTRPLFPYLGASEAFQCPADVGIELTNLSGVLMEPSCFEVVGLSYCYNSGRLITGAPQATDGLGGKTLDWVRRPSLYPLMYEPPGFAGGTDDPRRKMVYWHRARKPGTGSGPLADGQRGPRVSAFLFVDGHAKFFDCSGQYAGFPTLPGVEATQ